MKNHTRTTPLSRAIIWAGFWMAGAVMMGLFGGIGWAVIAPALAGWLS